MKKLVTISKIFDVIRIIVTVILVIATVAVVLGIVALLIGGEDTIQKALAVNDPDMIITAGGLSFTYANGIVAYEELRPLLLLGLCIALAACGAWMYVLLECKRMLRPLKAADPFDPIVSTGFRRLGWFAIIYGVMANIFSAVLSAKAAAVVNSALTNIGASVATAETIISLAFVLIALLLFLLSYVFRYGEELQQLSDETL